MACPLSLRDVTISLQMVKYMCCYDPPPVHNNYMRAIYILARLGLLSMIYMYMYIHVPHPVGELNTDG